MTTNATMHTSIPPLSETRTSFREDRLESCARELNESGDYRVLRKLKRPEQFGIREDQKEFRTALVIDSETTGLDVRHCAIIQLAMLKFSYSESGHVCRIIDQFNAFEDPGFDIPAEVTALTGIGNSDVRGKRIDRDEVTRFVSDTALVIAHNSAYDRPCIERYFPEFAALAWGCSATEVEWRHLGFESAKLSALAQSMGWFYGTHRADQDVLALLHLLASAPHGGEQTALSMLLNSARRSTARLWAVKAPFRFKDELKSRGYKWNAGGDAASPRAWSRELDLDQVDSELDFLRRNVYCGRVRLPIQDLTAYNRYSFRQPFRHVWAGGVSTQEYSQQ